MYFLSEAGAGHNVCLCPRQRLKLNVFCLSEQGLDLMYVFVRAEDWTECIFLSEQGLDLMSVFCPEQRAGTECFCSSEQGLDLMYVCPEQRLD